jgi:hypothetical protein
VRDAEAEGGWCVGGWGTVEGVWSDVWFEYGMMSEWSSDICGMYSGIIRGVVLLAHGCLYISYGTVNKTSKNIEGRCDAVWPPQLALLIEAYLDNDKDSAFCLCES